MLFIMSIDDMEELLNMLNCLVIGFGLCYMGSFVVCNIWGIIGAILEYIQFLFFACIILCLTCMVMGYPATMLLIYFVAVIWHGYDDFGYHDMFIKY